MHANPRLHRRPLAASVLALAGPLVLSLVASLVLSLACALAVPAVAQAAEADSTRKTMGDILDSLTHAPKPQQGQTATGFPGTPVKSGQFPSSPGQSPPSQSIPRQGPTAPTQPKAPVVKTLPSQPAGAPLPGSPLSTAPLPGSAFSDAPASPGQPATPQSTRPATQAAPRQRPESPSQNLYKEDTLRLVHDGLERLALVRLPKAKALKKGQTAAQLPAQKLPLVIFLHGAGGSARQAMQQTGLAELGARAGFIAVFPEGLAAPPGFSGPGGQEYVGIQTWNAWSCCGFARDQKIDDVGFLAALIGRLKADYPVDPRRIHLAGFSNGAMLASRFALERPGVLAAIASVAGSLPCDVPAPKEPLPVLVIHGNHDRMARFGPAPGQPRTGRFCEDFPAKAQVDFWVRSLNLKAKPQHVQDGQKSRTRTERYGPDTKAGRALVEYVIVKGGGHAWPGGERVRYRYCDLPTPDPDATAMLWDFFKRQARGSATEKQAATDKPSALKKPGKKVAKGKG